MQNIARELQHSETTFIFPASAGGDARVRIFGPDGEFPFAGHPTLGTAFVMAKSIKNKRRLILEENVGPIPVDLKQRSDGLYLEMKQNDPTFGIKPEPTMLARALGFEVGEIDDRYAPQVVSTGLPWLIIPLKSASTLEKLQHGRSLPPDEAKRIEASPYFLVTGERDIEARVFGVSGPEDPATGSGAGDAVSFMTRYGNRKPNQNLTIYQGRFANRPSVIYASASLGGGSVTNVRVGGHVVEVMRGRITM